MNNKILDIIINYLDGIKSDNVLKENCQQFHLHGCKYLLNQTIRQLQLPDDHILISEKAQNIWNSITTENIKDYYYQKVVTKITDDDVVVDKYKGSIKKAYETVSLKKYDKFHYRDVFIDEHIVPVSDIIDALLLLPDHHDYNSVLEILNKIYVCKMLREESFNLKAYNRGSLDYKTILDTHYTNAKIKIVGLTPTVEQKNKMQDNEIEYHSIKYPTRITNSAQNDNFVFKGKGFIIKLPLQYDGRCYGYPLLKVTNNTLEYLGLVIKETDKGPHHNCCTIHFSKNVHHKYGEWKRFKCFNQRINFFYLERQLQELKAVELSIDML